MSNHEIVKIYDLGGKRLKIIQDSDECHNPRTNGDPFGEMFCWHKRYRLGDEHTLATPGDFDRKKYEVVVPLFLLDHGGITMQTTPFNDPWDSGQVGWLAVTAEKIVAEFGELTPETRDKARELLRSEARVYDQFLTGDVYGFVLEDEDGTHLDSCWGFFGEDPLENGMVEHLETSFQVSLRRVCGAS